MKLATKAWRSSREKWGGTIQRRPRTGLYSAAASTHLASNLVADLVTTPTVSYRSRDTDALQARHATPTFDRRSFVGAGGPDS